MPYKTDDFNADFILKISKESFEDTALALFQYQYQNNELYKAFADALNVNPNSVKTRQQIPFLPIPFFKTHTVLSGSFNNIPLRFESSGTTGEITSKHYVADETNYRTSLLVGFEQFYGSAKDYTFLALLPSYLERQNASLVHMAKILMEESTQPDNGFYLNEFEKLATTLKALVAEGKKVLVLGVTFALLDFAEQYPMDLKHAIVMETGGMKGRREEMTREQVHSFLKERWHVEHIHSEYGMTELLSQAYALQNGVFKPSATMQVLVRDINDPMDVSTTGTGCLNIIDLANIHSCSFIATEDIGTVYADGSFMVKGRVDNSALRGCNLMIL